MPTYYLDIETTGLDPQKDKIITIQYQEIDRNTAKPIKDLVLLKEWESSEREILYKFIEDSRITEDYPFSFVPVGYNLGFEDKFLKERTATYGLSTIDVLNKPFLDLRVCGVIMNNGEFKGSGLDKLTGKPHDGRRIPEWYYGKEYNKIEEYVRLETKEFHKFNMWLYKELPLCLTKFKENANNVIEKRIVNQ